MNVTNVPTKEEAMKCVSETTSATCNPLAVETRNVIK
jgi:hypothetical protein